MKQHTDIILTHEEMTVRLNLVAPFLFESSKQYFESLKFALNAWLIINTSATVAIIYNFKNEYYVTISMFIFGTLFSGIGHIMLLSSSKINISDSLNFVTDSTTCPTYFLNLEKLITKYFNIFRVLLALSYFSFAIGVLSVLLYL